MAVQARRRRQRRAAGGAARLPCLHVVGLGRRHQRLALERHGGRVPLQGAHVVEEHAIHPAQRLLQGRHQVNSRRGRGCHDGWAAADGRSKQPGERNGRLNLAPPCRPPSSLAQLGSFLPDRAAGTPPHPPGLLQVVSAARGRHGRRLVRSCSASSPAQLPTGSLDGAGTTHAAVSPCMRCPLPPPPPPAPLRPCSRCRLCRRHDSRRPQGAPAAGGQQEQQPTARRRLASPGSSR